jgi:PAS domain S-box-containing protein
VCPPSFETTCARERFERIAALSREVIWEADARGVYTYISPGAADVYGYSPEELVGICTCHDRYFADGDEKSKVNQAASFSRGEIIRGEERKGRRKDGTFFWVLISATPIFGPAGEIVGYCGIDSDMTERKWSEQCRDMSHGILQILNEQGGLGGPDPACAFGY